MSSEHDARIIEGEPYSQSKLDYSKRRVNALGAYPDVDLFEEFR